MNEPPGPDDAHAFIAGLLPRIRAALPDDFVGMYPFGSLATGDFDPASSDLDLLVALAREPDDPAVERLRALHAEIERIGGPWSKRLEVAYIPVAALRRVDSKMACRWAVISPVSPFGAWTEPLDASWVLNLRSVLDGGISFAGPTPGRLIDPIDGAAVREAARLLLVGTWSRHVDGPDWMRPRKYQAFTILTMCRALHALDRGRNVSKPRAAAWALGTLDPGWHPLIRRALADRLSSDPSSAGLAETLDFVQFAVRAASADPPAGSR